jgi:small subunit ribosomal protein S8
MDPLANLLTSIRNAEAVNHQTLTVPQSNQGLALLRILVEQKYLASIEEGTGPKPRTTITLIPNRKHKLKRMSTPGRRLYVSAKEIPLVLNGLGHVIISTSKGMMIGRDARRQGLGGELICKVS